MQATGVRIIAQVPITQCQKDGFSFSGRLEIVCLMSCNFRPLPACCRSMEVAKVRR